MDISKVGVLMRQSFGNKKLKFQDSRRIRIARWLCLMLESQKRRDGCSRSAGAAGPESVGAACETNTPAFLFRLPCQ